jgi:hypothetical protein
VNVLSYSRILTDGAFRGGPKARYWALRKEIGRHRQWTSCPNAPFRAHVANDLKRYFLGGVHPVAGETAARARAAADWILRAQTATPGGGVSLGYFPADDGAGTKASTASGWRAPYPETTGYIIPSLLEFARRFADGDARKRALEMAEWEIRIQMPSGAVQGGPLCPPEKQTPAAFNTGMVLQGWTEAYRETRDARFLDAGRRAADFLVNDVNADGYFKTNGQFVVADKIKTYNCLCAWALYRFGEDSGDDRYRKTAVRVIEAALKQQARNGWFANNCLDRPEAPLTHTIGYTLQGILEVGILAGREDFMDACARGTEPLLATLSREGFLHGCYYADWKPAAFTSCLTGSAQLAIVCYRLFERRGDAKHRDAADRLLNYLKALQTLDSPDPAMNGALAGSFPITGGYMSLGYPNWATKYLLDALLFQHRLSAASEAR